MELERINDFIASYYEQEDPFLNRLEEEAERDDVPIIRRDARQLVKVILAVCRPERILEIGTATGFSAILMVKYGLPELKITTVEDYPPRVEKAVKNIREAGLEDRIELIHGDGEEVMAGLTEKFDMIFIDAAKAQYPRYFECAGPLLKKGGVLLADNCIKEGEVVESKFAVTRRNRTIHKRMREFLFGVTHSDDYTASILSVGDGMVLAVKNH